MALTKNQRIVLAAAISAAVIGGAATIIAADMTRGDDGGKGEDNTRSVDGTFERACGVTVGGSGEGDGDSNVVCEFDTSPTPPDDFSGDEAPGGEGPWPYTTVKTVSEGQDLGVFVRSCPWEKGCDRVGHVFKARTLWVLCRQRNTGFTAGWANYGAEDTWLKVAWPTDRIWRKGDPELESTPDSPHAGWILSYFTSPVEHSGDVPDCVEDTGRAEEALR
ncbi:hypothetical protein F0L17_21885 [Streptomyces sp. TRM43335]|uniref:Secreted protein n=1 Tax=Streptomyces taklimakanensis TaxID=2569853 RepID=A0A6G2BHM8_9ACTN|nr:hypothetical protein [Streptomyces taklimakanensis]MTE21714.1 hypothetical protein [Streptomyces taklimakanensis]